MLNENEVTLHPLELGESHFSTGKFHLMDIVFRRWSSLLEDTFYSEMDLMVDVSSENIEKMRFEEFKVNCLFFFILKIVNKIFEKIFV